MSDESPMVTSCPLCLAPDEVESMVTVEIERAIPRGRFAVMICRNCTVAVIEAAAQAEPPLLTTLLADNTPPIDPAVWKAGIEKGVTQTAYAEGIKKMSETNTTEPTEEPDVAPEGIER